MPTAPKRPCSGSPTCPHFAGSCPIHARDEDRARLERLKVAEARRPMASQRGYDQEWFKVRARFLRVHPLCGCGAKATQVHHVRRLRDGGGHTPDNLRAMCARCHSRLTLREDVPRANGGGR